MELREDGRKLNEIRVLTSRIGTIEASDGSAYFEMGNTKVIACVYGPVDIQEWKNIYHDDDNEVYVKCSISYSSFCRQQRRVSKMLAQDSNNVEKCAFIEKSFHETIHKDFFQKSRVELDLLILQCDGSEMAACINAATLAFVNAGIPMNDFLCSCTAAVLYQNVPTNQIASIVPQLVVDVNNSEISKYSKHGYVSIAVLGETDKVLFWHLERGKLVGDLVGPLFKLAVDACHKVCEFLHRSIKESALTPYVIISSKDQQV